MSSMQKYLDFSQPYAELSAKQYNLTIAGSLTWGFVLTWLLSKTAGPAFLRMSYTSPDTYGGIMLFGLIAYFILTLVGSRLLRSFSAVTSIIGFHMIAIPVGLLASIAVAGYTYMDPTLVARAALMTAAVTAIMGVAAMVRPDAFATIGRSLSVALFAVIIVDLVSMFLPGGYRMMNIIDNVVVLIMGLFIGVDWGRANTAPHTVSNAVAAAAMLYLDIINIFLRILRIMARKRD